MGGFRVGVVGFGVIEKAGKAKKRAELSGRRGGRGEGGGGRGRGERKNHLPQNYCFLNYPSTGEREILIC